MLEIRRDNGCCRFFNSFFLGNMEKNDTFASKITYSPFIQHYRMPLYYHLTLFACGVSSIVLAMVLIGLSIRNDEALQKYGTARWCLSAAFVVFGIANLMQVGMESDGKEEALTGVMTLVIGSINAMMFTTVVHVFIRPSVVTMRNIVLQGAVILTLSMLLFVARFAMPTRVFYIVYYLSCIGYLILLAAYTYYFLKNYQVFKQQILSYYEEEELLYRLRWVRWTFWSALGVGVSALLLTIDHHNINMLLTGVFTAYYIFVTISFINYQQYAQLVLRAYEQPETPSDQKGETTDDSDNADMGVALQHTEIERLTSNISKWVSLCKYAETDKSVDEIATDLGTDSKTLRLYFTTQIGEDFRSWRNRIRIEEARRLFDAQPSMKITEVMTLTGFNDRPYFYRIFQKIVGVSVAEYRKGKPDTT